MARKKSLLKTITWRISASAATILIVYILSGEMKIAGSVAVLEVIVKTLLYYFHEIVWDKVDLDEKKDKKVVEETAAVDE